jgi:hypothetical protein
MTDDERAIIVEAVAAAVEAAVLRAARERERRPPDYLLTAGITGA